MRILGIDPGLQTTGFGVVDVDGSRLSYVGSGTIKTTHLALGDLPVFGGSAGEDAELASGLAAAAEAGSLDTAGFGPVAAAGPDAMLEGSPRSALTSQSPV